MLTVEDVSASYGNVRALWDVTLDVEEGEVVSIIGPNGAGKSTLLRSIMGMKQVDHGNIMFRGKEITGDEPHRIAGGGIAFVPEGRRLFPEMTVEENLRMGAPRKCADAGTRMQAVFDMFPQVMERLGKHAGTLSGGEQQMVAIGRALMGKPTLLVLDEPSFGLSPAAADRVSSTVRRLAGGATSVLLAEQNVEMALEASDRVYVFAGGRVAACGTSDDMRDDLKVRKAYLGPEA